MKKVVTKIDVYIIIYYTSKKVTTLKTQNMKGNNYNEYRLDRQFMQ